MIIGVSFAKEKAKETNIICFAAKDKWVCAPKDQQQVANEKAKKLLKENTSELATSDVIIKTIKVPKFTDSETAIFIPPKNITKKTNKAITPEYTAKPIAASGNPYAKLWSHQLIGVSTPQSAVNYVRENHLDKNEVLIIKSKRADMDWWIVLYGLYKDKQTGLDNKTNLPSSINKPWLRPLRNLEVNGFIDAY